MKVKPILHRVLVKPEEVEETDELLKRARLAGIQIELDKREKKATVIGTIVSVGSTAYKEFGTDPQKEGIVEGTKVLYAKYSGAEIPNTELIILNDEDIIGVLENE